jgi:hypothetical protein
VAKFKDNYVVMGLSGKIGKLIFKTKKSGLTYTSLPPDRRNVVSTKNQKKLRNNFAKAVAYAKSVLNDPLKAEPYRSRKNNSLYITALKDYLYQQKGALKKTNRLIITEEFILKHRLNIRQVKALRFLKKRGRISNSDYQRLNHISKPTATRDLQGLVKMSILNPSGIRGAGAFYEIMGSYS